MERHDHGCKCWPHVSASEAEAMKAERDVAIDTAATLASALDRIISAGLGADEISALSMARGLKKAAGR